VDQPAGHELVETMDEMLGQVRRVLAVTMRANGASGRGVSERVTSPLALSLSRSFHRLPTPHYLEARFQLLRISGTVSHHNVENTRLNNKAHVLIVSTQLRRGERERQRSLLPWL